MEREIAKKIAIGATMKEVIKTLQNAESKITNWNVRSEVNRGLSKGVTFNIFTKYLVSLKENHAIPEGVDFYTFQGDWQFNDIKEKIIWEFGEFYPDVTELIKNWELNNFSHSKPEEVDWSKLIEEEPEIQRIK